jgi:D-lactate dehydrogenase (cytochrome)
LKDNAARDLEGLHQALTALVGADRVSRSHAVREQHGHDESYHAPQLPDLVVFAHSTEEVSGIVKACAARHVPIVPFGAGTALEGHVCAVEGGVCIDLSQMNEIVRVSPDDMDATVQAGVTRKQLNEHLRDTGLFFSVDPGADATIGGMAATRASGTNAVRYGTMRENVLSLTVVLADGRVITTSRRTRKSASGYDLTRLFVGSEGTLGVITDVTVKLHGIPQHVAAAVCAFPTIEGAINTSIATIQCGVPVARIEFLDDAQMAAVNAFSKTDYKVAPTLMLEFHGTESGVAEQVAMVQEIAADHGGTHFQWATRPEDRDRLWSARHNAYYAGLAARPGSAGMVSDQCVPISKLAECVVATKEDLVNSSIPACIVGHVGDGNFHTVLMIDLKDPAEIARASAINEKMVLRSLALGGTSSGEHGVGLGKKKFLEVEHGEALSVMRAIKSALDPDNIMNPGKIL